MNPLDRYAVPEPEFTDEEMGAARETLFVEWAERGWPREDAAKHIDDQLVFEQAEFLRRAAVSDHVDAMWSFHKEGM